MISDWIKKTVKKKIPLFLLLLFFPIGSAALFAQDGYLLIEQYRQGPDLGSAYSPWEVDLIGSTTYWIPENKVLSPRLNYLAQIRVMYRPAKSLALISGFDYIPKNYTYETQNTIHLDRLTYFSVPLGIRLFPYKMLLSFTLFIYDFSSCQKCINNFAQFDSK